MNTKEISARLARAGAVEVMRAAFKSCTPTELRNLLLPLAEATTNRMAMSVEHSTWLEICEHLAEIDKLLERQAQLETAASTGRAR